MKHNRRMEDTIKSKNSTRNMNCDRRFKNSERRSIDYSLHDGSPRRLTVDRRLMTKDRRMIKGGVAI